MAVPAGQAEEFEEHRARLRTVAQRMLGSWPDADDAVLQTWDRVSQPGAGPDRGAWLTTVLVRVCLDKLRAGPLNRQDAEPDAPLAGLAGQALAAVLAALTPAERLVFVLHDVFDVPFADIAPLTGRSPSAARRLAVRARRRLGGGGRARRPGPDPAAGQQEVVDAFAAAARAGDAGALAALLDPGVRLRAHGAAGRPAEVHGAAAEVLPMRVNGAAGLVIVAGRRPVLVLAFSVAGGVITAIDAWPLSQAPCTL